MTDSALQEASRLVGEDLAYQRRIWRFQRWGWAGLGLLVLLGALGAFGDGPLAGARTRSEDGAVEVEWERIERAGRDSTIRLRTVAPHAGPLLLRMEEGFVDRVTVSAAEPRAAGEARAPGLVQLRFDPPPEGRRAEVVLSVHARRPGLVTGRLVLGESAVSLHLVILP